MIEQTTTKTETFDTFSIKFYRNKRIFRSFICSFTIAYLTESPFWFVFSHVMATVFWEWWFFSYWNVKESSVIPEWYLEMQGTNREKVDQYVSFMVNLRRVTACLSCGVILLCYAFWRNEIGMDLAFLGTYTISTVFAWVMADYIKGIKHFYPNFISLGSRSGSITRNIVTPGENTWTKTSITNDYWDRKLTDATNPLGFTNPISPNYTGRSMFDH